MQEPPPHSSLHPAPHFPQVLGCSIRPPPCSPVPTHRCKSHTPLHPVSLSSCWFEEVTPALWTCLGTPWPCACLHPASPGVLPGALSTSASAPAPGIHTRSVRWSEMQEASKPREAEGTVHPRPPGSCTTLVPREEALAYPSHPPATPELLQRPIVGGPVLLILDLHGHDGAGEGARLPLLGSLWGQQVRW